MGGTDKSIDELREVLLQYRKLDSARARALPGCFYTQQNFLDDEIEILLRREWLCVGRVDEIPNPGDYFTADLLDEPLLVVRGDDNQVRILSNVCRHRGILVAEGAGRKRRFVCPYHGWTYKLDGRLAGAPRMESQAEFDPERRLPSFIDKWNAINAEDKEKLSRVQRGMGSHFSTPGPLASENYAGTIWDFYQYRAFRLTERSAV